MVNRGELSMGPVQLGSHGIQFIEGPSGIQGAERVIPLLVKTRKVGRPFDYAPIQSINLSSQKIATILEQPSVERTNVVDLTLEPLGQYCSSGLEEVFNRYSEWWLILSVRKGCRV